MKKKTFFLLAEIILPTILLSHCHQVNNTSKEPPYTVTMVLTGVQQKDELRIESAINAILQPALNMNLDLVVLSWGSVTTQLPLMLYGDEKIDCFYTDANSAFSYKNNGQLVNVSHLIEQYGNNIKTIFDKPALDSLSIDGFTLGIPAHSEGTSIPAIFMRKDLIEKYHINIEEVSALEDLDSIFALVSSEEPEMDMLFSNGSANGPLYRYGISTYDALGDGIGVLMNPTDGNTDIVNLYETDWYFDTAQKLYEWYQLGYINENAATETDSWNTKLKSGRVFSMITGNHPGILTELKTATGYDFVCANLSDFAVCKNNYYSVAIYCIAQNSENPEKTMQCLDFIYGNADIMNLLNWGEEGIDYVFLNENQQIITYPEGITLDNVGYHFDLSWELPNQYITYLWEGSYPNLYEETIQFNKTGKNSIALGFIFNTTGYEAQIIAVEEVIKKYAPSINSGTVNPEKYIPLFIEELKSAGIDDIISEKQQQFNHWLHEKNKSN